LVPVPSFSKNYAQVYKNKYDLTYQIVIKTCRLIQKINDSYLDQDTGSSMLDSIAISGAAFLSKE
jgi:hypothetical protein